VPAPLRLPAGYRQRPLSFDDAAAVTEVIAADEAATIGEVAIEVPDIVAEWQRPSKDVPSTTVGVEHAGRLVAYAEHMGDERSDASVHPDHCGRGIGTELARWLAERARELGEDEIGMPRVVGTPGDRLLALLGWEVRYESWVLELPAGVDVPPRPLPDGYTLREATPADHEAAWTVNEDAFAEWSGREREPFADWRAEIVGRPGFEPWHLRVVTDETGTVVAMANVFIAGTEGHVRKLATRADQRGRGLAQALLADSFRVARAHGATRSTLNTDSRTGALDLYRRVGLDVVKTYHHRALALTRK